MAWYNPSTWAPVDAFQNSLGTVKVGNAGSGWAGSGLSSQPRTVSTSSQPKAAPAPAPAPQNTGDGGVVNSGYSAPVVNPYQAQIDALNAQLGTLDTQQGIGESNINNSYNQSLQALYDQFGRAQRDYQTGVSDTEHGYTAARNAAQINAHNKLSALQRLLGLNGAGNSSASQDAVPLAVAQESSQAIAPVQNTYAVNRRNQDTAFGDTTVDKQTKEAQLAQAKFQQQQALHQNIAQTRADLLSKITNAGGADYGAQVASLLQQVAQLGNQYQNAVPTAAPVAYKAPDLMQYLLGQTGDIQQSNVGGDSVNPLFVPLLGKKEDQFATA